MCRPPAQRVLVAYTADLITVLQSLFVDVTRSSSSETPRITSRALAEVYQAHKLSDTRRQIYRRISAQIPGCDKDVIRRLLCELLEYGLMSPPDSVQESKMVAASSSPSSGVAAQSPTTGMATPSPPTRVAPPSSLQRNGVPVARAPPGPPSNIPVKGGYRLWSFRRQ